MCDILDETSDMAEKWDLVQSFLVDKLQFKGAGSGEGL